MRIYHFERPRVGAVLLALTDKFYWTVFSNVPELTLFLRDSRNNRWYVYNVQERCLRRYKSPRGKEDVWGPVDFEQCDDIIIREDPAFEQTLEYKKLIFVEETFLVI